MFLPECSSISAYQTLQHPMLGQTCMASEWHLILCAANLHLHVEVFIVDPWLRKAVTSKVALDVLCALAVGCLNSSLRPCWMDRDQQIQSRILHMPTSSK